MLDYLPTTQAHCPNPSKGSLADRRRSLERLTQSLLTLPDYWKLVPCRNKIPLGKEWGKNFFTPQTLFRSLSQEGSVWVKGKQGYYQTQPNGYSLLCGSQLSNRYLVAIDCDSQAALDRVAGKGFPPTITYCSGREGRRQYLYYLDRPIKNFSQDDLEVRGDSLLATLPPSVHPNTGNYRWLMPPNSVEIPTLSSLWVDTLRRIKPAKKKIVRCQLDSCEDIERLVWSINPVYADNYDSWIRIGMALKHWSDRMLWLWDDWSRQSSKYKSGEPEAKWDSFTGNGITYKTLYYYARR